MYRLTLSLLLVAACFRSAAGDRDAAAKKTGPELPTPQGKVAIFPADNPWNQDITKLPVHRDSATYIAALGAEQPLHADFGTVWQGAPNGIPYVIVPANQKKVKVKFAYADESDPGPYPLPDDAPIEGGPQATGDRHILIVAPAAGR
jgi:hypothetical protein